MAKIIHLLGVGREVSSASSSAAFPERTGARRDNLSVALRAEMEETDIQKSFLWASGGPAVGQECELGQMPACPSTQQVQLSSQPMALQPGATVYAPCGCAPAISAPAPEVKAPRAKKPRNHPEVCLGICTKRSHTARCHFLTAHCQLLTAAISLCHLRPVPRTSSPPPSRAPSHGRRHSRRRPDSRQLPPLHTTGSRACRNCHRAHRPTRRRSHGRRSLRLRARRRSKSSSRARSSRRTPC